MPLKRDDQPRLPFLRPTPIPPLSPETTQRCKDLLSQMLCRIVISEIRPEEVNDEREDPTDPP